MSIVIYADGREMAHTSIVLPKAVRDEARARKISISEVAAEALKIKFMESPAIA